MPTETRKVQPGPKPHLVRTEDGTMLQVPEGWACLPPGDAGLTRRLKKACPTWTVQEKRGRKVFSKGVWAPATVIEHLQNEREQETQDPAYLRRLEAARQRRAVEQEKYADEFYVQLRLFLDFHERYEAEAIAMATAIAEHAVPVGSNTVARTQRIPIEARAEAATIAWMRHQTTAYDNLKIPNVKGMRREVRRMLAQRSHALLRSYRSGTQVDSETCPLQRALALLDDSEPIG